MVSTGEEQCARGKFRVIMQYMEPHCIAELEDGWQSIGRVQTCAQMGRLGEGWDIIVLFGTLFRHFLVHCFGTLLVRGAV